MRQTRLVLWALDPSLSLEEVQEKLKFNYSESRDLTQLDLPEEERTYYHRWEVYSGKQRELNLTDKKINYIFAKGFLELDRYSKKYNFERSGKLIPKKHRVSGKEIETIFFEMYDRIYAVLAVPKSYESKVRSKLFIKEYGWGRIDYRELPQFNLSVDFFNWLMIKEGQKIVDSLNRELTLEGFNGFSSASNRTSSEFTGTGGDILNQPATKTMIGTSRDFRALELTVKYKHLFLKFYLGGLSETIIDDKITHKIESSGEPAKIDPHEAIIYIYSEIIPLLTSAYHIEIENGTFKPKFIDFKKENGLRAIEDICKELGLTISEISKLDYFNQKLG